MGTSPAQSTEGVHKNRAAVARSGADQAGEALVQMGLGGTAEGGVFQSLIAGGVEPAAVEAESIPHALSERLGGGEVASDEAANGEAADDGREGLSLIENLLQWLRGPAATAPPTSASLNAHAQAPLAEVAPEPLLAMLPSQADITAAGTADTAGNQISRAFASGSITPEAAADLEARQHEDRSLQPLADVVQLAREPVPAERGDPRELVMAAAAAAAISDASPSSAVPVWSSRLFEPSGTVPPQAPTSLPSPAAPLSTDLPDWPQNLGERIAWSVNGDQQDALIELHPAELGSLTVRIETRGADAQVTIIAGTAVARDLLQQSLPQLRELLMVQGLNLARAQIERPAASARPDEHASSRERGAGSGAAAAGGRRRISRLLLVDAYA